MVKHHGVCVWNVRNKPKTREQTQNSETKNRGAGVKHRGVCVECSKQTQNSITNPKLRKKKSWGGRWASWCVCGMVKTNPKLDNIFKTWKQRILRHKIHLLQKVGKKLYTGDKINLLQKVGKSKIKKFRVKLYRKIILRIRLMTGVKRNTFNKR